MVLSNCDHPELDGDHGVTLDSQALIIIDEDLPRDRMIVVLVHEMLHAIGSTPGETKLLARILGCADEDDALKREEDIVTHYAPKLADMLVRANMLRVPPLPKRRR